MLTVELPTYEILKFLKEVSFPFYQKTLVKDSVFKVPVGIFTPIEAKNNKYNKGIFQSLLSQPIFDRISIIDIVPTKKDIFFTKEFLLTGENSIKVSSSGYYSLLEIKQKVIDNHFQNIYTTLFIPKIYLEKKSISSLHPWILSENFYFPFPVRPSVSQKIAIIYDKEIPNAQKEALMIYNRISSQIKNYNNISLFALPLMKEKFYDIFNTHQIIHYAGHITKKGFYIRKNYSTIPMIINPPHFVFLNGCTTPPSILTYFSSLGINTLFSSSIQVDSLILLENIELFYTGLYLGYRIKDLVSIFSNHLSFSGWAHFAIQGYLHEN